MPTASPHRVCGSVTAVLPPTFRKRADTASSTPVALRAGCVALERENGLGCGCAGRRDRCSVGADGRARAAQEQRKQEDHPNRGKDPRREERQHHTSHRYTRPDAPKSTKRDGEGQPSKDDQHVAGSGQRMTGLKPLKALADRSGLLVTVGGLSDRGGNTLVTYHLQHQAHRLHPIGSIGRVAQIKQADQVVLEDLAVRWANQHAPVDQPRLHAEDLHNRRQVGTVT
jgi:hypothetical protein